MREEAAQARQHELQLFQMLSNQGMNPGYNRSYEQAYHAAGPCGESSPSGTGWPTWQGGYGQAPSNQTFLPGRG